MEVHYTLRYILYMFETYIKFNNKFDLIYEFNNKFLKL